MNSKWKRYCLTLWTPILIIGAIYLYRSRPLDLGDPERIQSVEIEIFDWATESHPTQSTIVTSQDAVAIAKLIGVLESGERIVDCRCAWSGFIRFADEAEESIELQLVPGHGVDTFDIRYDGRRYSIDRVALEAAIQGLGAKLPDK